MQMNTAGLVKKAHILSAGYLFPRWQVSESFAGQDASHQHRLSLVPSQLKVGSANQRHLFSPAATLLSRQFKIEKRNTNGNRNSEVV